MHVSAEWAARADLLDLGRVSRGWRRVLAGRRRILDATRRGKSAALDTCARYLEVGEAERESMREFFRRERLTLPVGRTGIQPLLHWALAEGVRGLRTTGAGADLRLGLAAASLEDFQFDGRTTLTGLGDLWLAAVEHGVFPRPAFEHVAGLSSRRTREVMGHFEDTAHFRDDLAPRIAKLGDPSR